MLIDLHAAAASVRQALFHAHLEVIVTAQGGGRAKLHLSPGQARHLLFGGFAPQDTQAAPF
jgi:hypothetical protein